MSLAAVFQKLGESVMPKVLNAVSNGECRIMAFDEDDAIDDQGLPNETYTERTAGYIPCVWEVRAVNRSDADESVTGNQSKGIIRYKITVPRYWEGEAVVIESADRMELKQQVGADDFLTLDIAAPINTTNAVWEVLATDVNA